MSLFGTFYIAIMILWKSDIRGAVSGFFLFPLRSSYWTTPFPFGSCGLSAATDLLINNKDGAGTGNAGEGRGRVLVWQENSQKIFTILKNGKTAAKLS